MEVQLIQNIGTNDNRITTGEREKWKWQTANNQAYTRVLLVFALDADGRPEAEGVVVLLVVVVAANVVFLVWFLRLEQKPWLAAATSSTEICKRKPQYTGSEHEPKGEQKFQAVGGKK